MISMACIVFDLDLVNIKRFTFVEPNIDFVLFFFRSILAIEAHRLQHLHFIFGGQCFIRKPVNVLLLWEIGDGQFSTNVPLCV